MSARKKTNWRFCFSVEKTSLIAYTDPSRQKVVLFPKKTEENFLFRKYFSFFSKQVFFVLAILISLSGFLLTGCESWNQSLQNRRTWYPVLDSNSPYSAANGASSLLSYEINDPYPTTAIGPKGCQIRPPGYGAPPSKAQQVLQTPSPLK